MPDAPKGKPLTPPAGQGPPQTTATGVQARVARSNDNQSAALRGATLAFASRAERSSIATRTLETRSSGSDDGARKAAVIAGEANKVHTLFSHHSPAGGVR